MTCIVGGVDGYQGVGWMGIRGDAVFSSTHAPIYPCTHLQPESGISFSFTPLTSELTADTAQFRPLSIFPIGESEFQKLLDRYIDVPSPDA